MLEIYFNRVENKPEFDIADGSGLLLGTQSPLRDPQWLVPDVLKNVLGESRDQPYLVSCC